MKRVIGVDIGGTKVAAGLVDESGAITGEHRCPMAANGTPADGLAAVRTAIDALLENAPGTLELGGIGICSPGPLDPKTGVVVNPPNLPCWRNFPLLDEIANIYNVPIKVDNDANAAALAETLWGAGRGYRHVFCATIGTGIGTGIVFDGCIYHGRTGAAGEGGHMSIDYHGPVCGCGKPGCIEILASGSAIARRARTKLAAQPEQNSLLLELAHRNLDAVSSEMVGEACAEGDLVARQTIQETVELLALWLSNIVDLLDPDVLIMGGGASVMLRPFFHEIHSRMSAFCVNSRSTEIPVVPARYGADAGIAGGAALCFALRRNPAEYASLSRPRT
jgi:glucokinase